MDQRAWPFSASFSEEDDKQGVPEYTARNYQVLLLPGSNRTTFSTENNALILYWTKVPTAILVPLLYSAFTSLNSAGPQDKQSQVDHSSFLLSPATKNLKWKAILPNSVRPSRSCWRPKAETCRHFPHGYPFLGYLHTVLLIRRFQFHRSIYPWLDESTDAGGSTLLCKGHKHPGIWASEGPGTNHHEHRGTTVLFHYSRPLTGRIIYIKPDASLSTQPKC